MTTLSKQDMFDLAYTGLRTQGFAQAIDPAPIGGTVCVYFDATTARRCAWGWVDPANTGGQMGSVNTLKLKNCGRAAALSESGLTFAEQLQNAHDGVGAVGGTVLARLRSLAVKHNLTLPGPEVTYAEVAARTGTPLPDRMPTAPCALTPPA